MLFHMCMAALTDEETQKKGAIVIVHSLNNDSSNPNPQSHDANAAWDASQLLQKALPIRIVGNHFCTNPSSIAGLFFSSMARFMGRIGIVRVRFHNGEARWRN